MPASMKGEGGVEKSGKSGRVGRVRVRLLCRERMVLKSAGICLLAVLLLQLAAPGSRAAPQEAKSKADVGEDANGGEAQEEEGLGNAKYTVVTHTVPRPPHRTDFVRMRDKVRRQEIPTAHRQGKRAERTAGTALTPLRNGPGRNRLRLRAAIGDHHPARRPAGTWWQRE